MIKLDSTRGYRSRVPCGQKNGGLSRRFLSGRRVAGADFLS